MPLGQLHQRDNLQFTESVLRASAKECEDIKSISLERLVHRLGTGGYEVVHRVRRMLDHLLEV